MSIKKPDISIIIPAFNEAIFIGKCLESVKSQEFNGIYEIIVVDNASTDKTGEIASRLGAKTVIETKPGAAAARNRGVSTAQADILYFVDADCQLPPQRLQAIFQMFKDDSSLELITGPYWYLYDGFFPKFVTKSLKYFTWYHKALKRLTGIMQFPGGNFAIKKKVFNQVGGFDESIANQEIVLPDDLDLAIRLAKRGMNNILFDDTFAVYSSFRRVKRSPVRHTLVRFFASISMLIKARYSA